MTTLIHATPDPDAELDGLLQPPRISPELAERSVAQLTRIRLGQGTVNTCNPALADIDADGLDEIIVPHNRGEQDVITAFRGDGSTVWETTDAPFYHSVYDDAELYRGTHWHYRSQHRHLLTFALDIDGDGNLEIVCGLGPIHILDASTGRLKRSIDLDGLAQVWAPARLGHDGAWGLVAGVNHHKERGSLVAVDPRGNRLWQRQTAGMSFEDKMVCGDLTGDGLDDIAFSLADARRFEVCSATGDTLWTKDVPSEIGEDTHVDDIAIDRILDEGRQLATSTGACLFDAEGHLIWSLRDRVEHGQKIASVRRTDAGETSLYLNSKTGRRAYMIAPEGRILWEYGNFSELLEGRTLLTTAGGCIAWSAEQATELVQPELLGVYGSMPSRPETPVTLYLTVFAVDGSEVAKLPYQDVLSPGFVGAMCALPGHMLTRDRQDIAVITHNSSEILIFSPVEG